MSALATFLGAFGVAGDSRPQFTYAAGRRDLCGLFRSMGYTRGVEVGVWSGRFSKVLCESIPGLELTCVDPWQSYAEYREPKNDQSLLDAAYLEACERLIPFRCTVMRMTSVDAARLVPDRSVDFVYIDGNHTREFVLQDLAAWTPKVRCGGIVAGHDYHLLPRQPFIQVREAVDAFASDHGIEPVFVLAADKSPSYFWVVQ